MATLGSVALALCMLAAAYTSFQCVTPPNPPPINPGVRDRLGAAAPQSTLNSKRNILFLIWLYHILITAMYPHPPPAICPHPDRLDSKLFSWNVHSVACVVATLIGGSVRLSAYKQLGRNFTFQLAKPKALVKQGLYSYVQHPSYTGQFLVDFGNFLLVARRAGAIACWWPSVLDIKYLGPLVWTVITVLSVVLTQMKVRDEESMLKKEFGKEWEEYHAKTKRFVPGLF